jgi:hypothetical protein
MYDITNSLYCLYTSACICAIWACSCVWREPSAKAAFLQTCKYLALLFANLEVLSALRQKKVRKFLSISAWSIHFWLDIL